MQKIVNAEAKVGLRSSTMVRDSDICCYRNHRHFNNTTSKLQIQGTTGKESKPEMSRPKESKLAEGKNPVLPSSEFTEPEKTSRIDKKREYIMKKQD